MTTPSPLSPEAVPAVVRTVADLRRTVREWRQQSETIALVPTMGALHRGHMHLVDIARRHADRVIVSIFVNPTQFAPHEDFDDYPRREAQDVEKLATAGVDLAYAQSVEEMYPQGFATFVEVSGVSEGLCAQTRPHFFRGVATVVTKLLLQAAPDYAVFGEKDYQQLQVIKRLVQDLNIPVEIVPGPTQREADGLAISSRNQYLTAEERRIAPLLHATLVQAAQDIKNGAAPDDVLATSVRALEGAGFRRVDYFELRDADSLAPLAALTRPGRLLTAAWLGKTRLIDNVAVTPEQPPGA